MGAREFQFLGRNSGRSDKVWLKRRGFNVLVSIPRSEFWSFGLAKTPPDWCPLEEFQFLGRNSGRSDVEEINSARLRYEFQFLGRNSGRSDLQERQLPIFNQEEFQFLGRNSGRSDAPQTCGPT